MESSEKRRCNCSSSSPTPPHGGEVCAVDRISDLHESIIAYILSFLPMKSVVATSTLSKSWKSYWTKVTAFDFDDDDPINRNLDIVSFVNFILAKQTYESIQKLRICVDDRITPSFMFSDLERWTLTAISRNVRVLDLYIVVEDDAFCFPDELYTCRTLEVLKLRGYFHFYCPGTVVSLPKLSELELFFYVSYESIEYLPKLLAGCPVLEKLTIWFDYEDTTFCSISSASLKHLKIGFEDGCDTLKKVEIDAPALEQLSIYDGWPSQVSIHNRLTRLDKADLYLATDDPQVKIAELLQALHRAKTLKLSGETIMAAISNATSKLSVNFERLTSLYVDIYLVDLLDCCTKLQFLCIKSCAESDGIKWMDLVHIPTCLSSSLRYLAIRSFSGSEEDMVLLKFILHHGLVMERVFLWYPPSYETVDFVRRYNILKMASKLPKASPNCKIVEWKPNMRWTLTE